MTPGLKVQSLLNDKESSAVSTCHELIWFDDQCSQREVNPTFARTKGTSCVRGRKGPLFLWMIAVTQCSIHERMLGRNKRTRLTNCNRVFRVDM